jgi:arabinofuranosyltransferase
MLRRHDRQFLFFMLLVAAIGLYIGWKYFWFLTDDAYIAFRYVSNSILGHGYTWNPAPFRAVEGYTGFLWLVLLEVVWRAFGILPPQSANTLSLGFSFLSMVVATIAVMRLNLNRQLQRFRVALVALLLVGMLVNRTFLTWSSSGLETALFNCCFFTWAVITIFARRRDHWWLAGMTMAAALVYLSRPDGMLVVMSTLVLVIVSFISLLRKKQISLTWFVSIMPLAIPVLHMLWRKSYYGEWLPNTYYAKHVAAWPAAGVRYFASFVLEHGMWIWLIVLISVVVVSWRRHKGDFRRIVTAALGEPADKTADEADLPGRRLCSVVVAATVLIHVGYYTLIIGGDHFEWRVYSHLIPLVLVTLFSLLSFLAIKPSRALIIVVVFILFSVLIPWTHHQSTKDIEMLAEADTLKVPVSDKLPSLLHWLTKPHDALQDWLIDHHVCVRRMEHKLFWKLQLLKYPERTLHVPVRAGEFPVAYFTTVGVPGWVLPNVSIIDGYGLNDYVIARHAPYSSEERLMAHDRYPPENYVKSFAPNVGLVGLKKLVYMQRPPELELTTETIIALERYWEDKIVRGIGTSTLPVK